MSRPLNVASMQLNPHVRFESYFAWQDFVQCVAVIAKCNSGVWCDVSDINVLVQINDKLAFWMNLQKQ